MQRWLARLAFSFIIIGAWLVWEVYHSPTDWRAVLKALAAITCVALGFYGINLRHRMNRED
jgi:succinate dehydrogenase hydrophobic anchor subunit